MDIIGIMYEPVTVDGQEPVEIPGWHVNTPEPVDGWEVYSVQPNAPRRIYAGHTTFFYVFGDEAEFIEAATIAGLLPTLELKEA